jgi:hypothetical protein
MALFMLGLIVLAAVLAPFFGADSRDGRDWSADSFWRSPRRGSAGRGRTGRAGGSARPGGDTRSGALCVN